MKVIPNISMNTDIIFEPLDSVMQFIEENINLIDNNDFNALYEKAQQYLTEEYEDCLVPYLTEALLECDINPLNYMSKVPKHYLQKSGLRYLNIVEPIASIDNDTLSCPLLETLQLPKTLTNLDLDNFYQNKNLTIIYPGDSKEFLEKVSVYKQRTNYLITIKCVDGNFTYPPCLEPWGWDPHDHSSYNANGTSKWITASKRYLDQQRIEWENVQKSIWEITLKDKAMQIENWCKDYLKDFVEDED